MRLERLTASIRGMAKRPNILGSALLTGRHAIRSGTHSVPVGVPGGWGLVAWEKTLADLLSEGGYACTAYGTDPREREPVALSNLHTWVAAHVNRLIGAFQASTKQEPPIPMGPPLEHAPTTPAG
jgi:arylsulfatase A-like enzyme